MFLPRCFDTWDLQTPWVMIIVLSGKDMGNYDSISDKVNLLSVEVRQIKIRYTKRVPGQKKVLQKGCCN